ncbi:hypothetical protein Sango_2278600 [Sesamum angolense]|uniref:Uncharacterized protein n=1 Tax=Sesamum angolense TaxID=2727404 RepID=A0AAE1WA93_9LAMI|nr:hypothetical protein Sango_2278600 [Sesamum angolense]
MALVVFHPFNFCFMVSWTCILTMVMAVAIVNRCLTCTTQFTFPTSLMQQLHLRRVGVEARQDMVPGIPKNDAGGSSSNQNDEQGGNDDAQDDRTGYGSPRNGSEPPLVPDGPDSGNSQNQHLSNAYLSNISGEHLVLLMLLAVMENEQAILASKAVLHFICEYVILDLLRTYLSSLYITLEV